MCVLFLEPALRTVFRRSIKANPKSQWMKKFAVVRENRSAIAGRTIEVVRKDAQHSRFRIHMTSGVAPLTTRLSRFASQRPWAVMSGS